MERILKTVAIYLNHQRSKDTPRLLGVPEQIRATISNSKALRGSLPRIAVQTKPKPSFKQTLEVLPTYHTLFLHPKQYLSLLKQQLLNSFLVQSPVSVILGKQKSRSAL